MVGASEDAMDIRAALRKLCDAFNAHDLDRIMGFFSEDCTLQMPGGRHRWGSCFEGGQNVRGALATRFEGLPDVACFTGRGHVALLGEPDAGRTAPAGRPQHLAGD